MHTWTLLSLGLMLVLASCATQPAARLDLAPVEKLPARPELPDPFRFEDGSRVQTKEDWARRRRELATLVQYYEYGQLPPAPTSVKGTEVDSAFQNLINANHKTLILETVANGVKINTRLEITTPQGNGPWPVIVCGDLCWGRIKGEILADAARRGYAVVEFDRTDFAPDSKDRSKGVYVAYPESDCAALAAWAWGYARVTDYLWDQKWVDREKIIFSGHSRGGKATLLAGAMDVRCALTNPNNSGCGGAGCYRLQAPKTEDIAAITKNFPFWFAERFRTFIGHVDQLPIDQHSVKALIAPRAYLSTEALGDQWANPPGTQTTHLAAKEVWQFLGAGDRMAIYFREGKHEHNQADWNVLMDYADVVLLGKKSETKFDNYAFPAERPYAWKKP